MQRPADSMIDLDTKARLIALLSLSESIPVIQRCVSALERTTTLGNSGNIVVNTKEIHYIYNLRIEMYRSRYGYVIDGGDELINALETEPGEQVRLCAFPSKKESFYIFTDPELERLIGCFSLDRLLR